MIPSLDRIVTDEHTLAAIKLLLQCKKCEKISESTSFYHRQCHSGLYCLECISACKQCYMSPGEYDPQLFSLLACSNIRCNNYTNGCSEIQKYGLISEHETFCPFKFNSLNCTKYNPFQHIKDAPMFFPKATHSHNVSQHILPPPIIKDQELNLTRRVELIEKLLFQHANECNINKKEFMGSIEKLQSNFNETFKEFIKSKPPQQNILVIEILYGLL